MCAAPFACAHMAAVLRAAAPLRGCRTAVAVCQRLRGPFRTSCPLHYRRGSSFRSVAPPPHIYQPSIAAHRNGVRSFASAEKAAMPAVQDTIVPTELEKRIFRTLKDAAKTLDPVVLRCAGGWVRDKLLGIETDSPDIDIALDSMTGEAFGRAVKAHLDAVGDAATLAVISSNPDQSKHLETATIKVHGVSLDLVNLRSETYAQDSRIPEAQFGTPEQDAARRDLTINALFYNLDTRTVEDLTGRGLDDLRSGIIRTPLAPRETFLDDPLRVLRAIRFAARYEGFSLDDALVEAASTSEVREALATKVSRERFGAEINGCFKGRDPVGAMRMVQQLRLFPTVFEPPPAAAAALGDAFGGPCCEVLAAAHELLQQWRPREAIPWEDRQLTLLAALLLPLRTAEAPPAPGASKKQKAAAGPVAKAIVRDALKWPAKGAPDKVLARQQAAAEFASIHAALQATGPGAAPAELRSRLGQAIRARGLESHWRCGVALAPLLSLPAAAPLGVESGSGASTGASDGGGGAPDSSCGAADRLAMAEALEAAAVAFRVDRAWETKPMLNGKQIMEAVGMQRAGPALGALTQKLLDWQLGRPDASADEARDFLLQQREASQEGKFAVK